MPLRLQGGIIGYQERAIDKKIFKTTETNLMYVDGGQILDNCIIVEGIFDAKSVPRGVACLHDSVNPRQAYLLRSKTPILLPDRDSTKYLDVMADYDWRLCVPGWDAKDANEALVKYGRLVVAKMIHDGICDTPLEAEIRYKLWQKR